MTFLSRQVGKLRELLREREKVLDEGVYNQPLKRGNALLAAPASFLTVLKCHAIPEIELHQYGVVLLLSHSQLDDTS